MSDIIVKLEDMLKASGIQDWRFRYVPQTGGYLLRIDGDTIYMKKVSVKF